MKELIDDMDAKIIALLEQNGRIPNTELAKTLNTSETTVRKRIKRLIENNIIKIIAIRNRSRLGHNTSGNIRIRADTKKTNAIGNELKQFEDIWYIAKLAGDDEFDLEFCVKSPYDLDVLLDKINQIDGVISTRPSIRLKLVKHLGEFMASFPGNGNTDLSKR